MTMFESPEHALNYLNFGKIYQKYWTSTNILEENENKRIQCAEVLVPNFISSKYIKGIYVYSEEAMQKVINLNLNIPVKIYKDIFFG